MFGSDPIGGEGHNLALIDPFNLTVGDVGADEHLPSV